MLVEQVFAPTIQQALGFDEHQGARGFKEVIHRVAEDFELRLDVLCAEAKRIEKWPD